MLAWLWVRVSLMPFHDFFPLTSSLFYYNSSFVWVVVKMTTTMCPQPHKQNYIQIIFSNKTTKLSSPDTRSHFLDSTSIDFFVCLCNFDIIYRIHQIVFACLLTNYHNIKNKLLTKWNVDTIMEADLNSTLILDLTCYLILT